MDFELTVEQTATRNTIRRFIAKECPREAARLMDDREEFPAAMLQGIAGMGICGLTVSEAYGGVGPDSLGAFIVAEEISTICPALAGAFLGAAFCGGRVISVLGNEGQKKRYLPGTAQGSTLFTYGLAEPDPGYSVMPSVKAAAVMDGDHLVLNGTKTFVRMADRAHYILTLAVTDENEAPQKGWSLFIVDLKSPGIRVEKMKKLGVKGLSLCQVVFQDVVVPGEDLLGGYDKRNRGWEQLAAIMESEHLETAACGLGIAQGAYDYAVNYAKERMQFNKPIVRFEAVQNMLVDMAVSIHASRLLAYRAAWLADRAKSCLLEAVMARTQAAEAAKKAGMLSMQVLGGYGYAMEYDVQRYVRDSLVLLGGGGTVEVFKKSMGRLLDLE